MVNAGNAATMTEGYGKDASIIPDAANSKAFIVHHKPMTMS